MEGLPAMTRASRDTPRKKEGGEKGRERERDRETERREGRGKKEVRRCSQLQAIVQGHTRERGEPERCIQEHPKMRKRGRGRGGRREEEEESSL